VGVLTINPNVTAIIPAFNEELAIGSVVLTTLKYVDQVIVVDDGSIDRTAEIAEAAGAEVIQHSSNQGKGAALRTGFQSIGDRDIVVTLDGDGQHNADEIPQLLKPIIDGEADIVNGSRYLSNNLTDTPSYRRIGQTVLDKATSLSSGLNLTDSQSGFRAFATYTLSAFKFNHNGFSIESEMLIDAANFGSRIMEVDIGVKYQNGSSSDIHKQNPFSHGLGVLVHLMQDMEFNRPLYYFVLPGLILIIVGITLGLFFFGSYLNHEMTSLLPTVMAAMIGLGGLFIAFTGIILHSMSRLIERNINK
jgi:glycosyltransferase involved in cell wall biosynthesis